MSQLLQLTSSQAQKIIVLQQQLHINSSAPRGEQGVLLALKHLGYIQIDSISVIVRAHHHSLYNRVKGYKEQHLNQLQRSAEIFEYWSHAAAYLPMSAYRHSLVRKLALKNGQQHWFKKDPKMMAHVLEKISDCGPMMAKDFSDTKNTNSGWWDWKPAKIALEQLFMQGDLMVTERRGFQKVYDLTENVLPADVDRSVPTTAQHCQFLIEQYLQANAIAKAEHFGYLLKGVKTDIKQQLQVMLEQGLIVQLQVGEQMYFARAGVEQLLKQKLSRSKVKILSPFDNILIQRKRMQQLFNFKYQLECYVPKPKRQFGYFSLPILQGQQFVGTMDVKVQRKIRQMDILHLHLHSDKLSQLLLPLVREIAAFMRFQDADSLHVEQLSAADNKVSRGQLQSFKQQLMQQLAG
ncbi:MAG: hypothetical protein OFPI_34790 [Osedax symbiont Rs2]|nr:MAG: hypothetical protein OFPI_34790 [Osedax symbiont Rs2]